MKDPPVTPRAGFITDLFVEERMLDTYIDRVRADRLREYIGERKAETRRERIEALEADQPRSVSEATGKIAAYEEVLRYLDAKATVPPVSAPTETEE